MSLEKFITKVLNVKADGIQKMTSIEEENGSLTLNRTPSLIKPGTISKQLP